MVENVEYAHGTAGLAQAYLTPRQLRAASEPVTLGERLPATGRAQRSEPPVIDMLVIVAIHGLLLLAGYRLMLREDLDEDPLLESEGEAHVRGDRAP